MVAPQRSLSVAPDAGAPPFAIVHIPTPHDRTAVAALGLDPFETGVLSVVRHLCAGLAEPASQGWRHALAIATERWPGGDGGRSVLDLLRILDALAAVRRDAFRTMDPLSLTCRALATPDESALMHLIAAMRRDLTAAARIEVGRLANGWIDPDLIVAALTFAARNRADLPAAWRTTARGAPLALTPGKPAPPHMLS
jgi:hypothetical protein